MPAPRLLLLCEFATTNGGEQSLLATLPAILRAGFEVSVALPEAGPFVDRLQMLDVDCIPFSLFDANSKKLHLDKARAQLAELLSRHQPDLLHANSLAMGRLSGPVAKDRRLPSLAHLRDIVNLRQQVITDLNKHTRLLAVSTATRDYHVAQGLDSTKMQVLYNGVDLNLFRPRVPTGYLHQELSLPATAPLIAMIGQIGLRKDPLAFLQAGAEVLHHHPNAHFILIGERHSQKEESLELEKSLHELTQSSRLKNHVHFLGVRQDIPELLSELTLLVHPARQEPLGRVLLEAAAAGVAIIASRVGGTPEIFPEQTGSAELFPAGDVQALANCMMDLLANKQRRQLLQQQARQRAEAEFDIRQRAGELVEIYHELSQ